MIEELKRIMNTADGRDFIYNFFLNSCGVDFANGIPSTFKDEKDIALKKPAIDIFNLLIYNCYEKFNLMLLEQEQRRNSHE